MEKLKTFKEEFPSVKDVYGREYTWIKDKSGIKDSLRLHCLDKQVVRNLIEKLKWYDHNNKENWLNADLLLSKLGLEQRMVRKIKR